LAEKEAPHSGLKSIVEQIEDVLQEKLAMTAYSNQGIHLLEGSGGEVLVQIGTRMHAGVETLPDPEVQALIRQAIAEWEKKTP
jgi:hypothetical protein